MTYNQCIDLVSGRIETRTCYVENKLSLYDDLASWFHFKSIIMVESKRETNEKISVEYRFYLSNLMLDRKDFKTFIRSIGVSKTTYIGIGLETQFDVTFSEHIQRAKTGNAAENLATVRKLALQILNKVQDKESLKNRRKMAAWSNEYLANILHEI